MCAVFTVQRDRHQRPVDWGVNSGCLRKMAALVRDEGSGQAEREREIGGERV